MKVLVVGEQGGGVFTVGVEEHDRPVAWRGSGEAGAVERLAAWRRRSRGRTSVQARTSRRRSGVSGERKEAGYKRNFAGSIGEENSHRIFEILGHARRPISTVIEPAEHTNILDIYVSLYIQIHIHDLIFLTE